MKCVLVTLVIVKQLQSQITTAVVKMPALVTVVATRVIATKANAIATQTNVASL